MRVLARRLLPAIVLSLCATATWPATTATTTRKRTSPARSTRKTETKATPKSAATPKPATPGKPSATPTPEKDAATTQTARRATPLPFDPYGFAQQFAERWDLTRFDPTTQEIETEIVNAAKEKARALQRAFERAALVAHQRETNLNNSMRALYLLRLANSAPAHYGADITLPHLAAVKSTLKRDIVDHRETLRVYSALRDASNAAAQEWIDLDEGYAAVEVPKTPPTSAMPNQIDVVREKEEAVFAGRRIDGATLAAIIEAEQLAREQQERTPLNAFAPAPPAPELEYNPLISPDTPIPEETGTARKPPPLPKLDRPAVSGVEIAAREGTPAHAAAAGKVSFAGQIRGFGNVVILEHEDELLSMYGYLGEVKLREGMRVNQGDVVGSAGSMGSGKGTGVHFEVRRQAELTKPSALLGNREPAEALGIR